MHLRFSFMMLKSPFFARRALVAATHGILCVLVIRIFSVRFGSNMRVNCVSDDALNFVKSSKFNNTFLTSNQLDALVLWPESVLECQFNWSFCEWLTVSAEANHLVFAFDFSQVGCSHNTIGDLVV